MTVASQSLLHPSRETNNPGNRGCRWVRINARSYTRPVRYGSDLPQADLPGSAIIYCLRVLDGAGTLGDKRLLVCADQQLISVH